VKWQSERVGAQFLKIRTTAPSHIFIQQKNGAFHSPTGLLRDIGGHREDFHHLDTAKTTPNAIQISAIYAVPFLRTRLLSYGSRALPEASKNFKDEQYTGNAITSILNAVASVQVPHSWFTHYYITSVASSLFWLQQLSGRGVFFTLIADSSFQSKFILASAAAPVGSMSLTQVYFLWLLLFIQGTRRLVESYTFAKPSKSTMHVAVWLIGIFFYLADGMAIWVEGIPALSSSASGKLTTQETTNAVLAYALSSPTSTFATLLFVAASLAQNRAHAHLFSLKTYQIPPSALFTYVWCPHYTAEIVIYICFALLAVPEGQWFNRTMVAAIVFVGGNLAVTANGTREWYIKRFGSEKAKGRARLVPGIW